MTLFLTDGVRHRDSEDEFHITTFFRVRFARDKLLSTLVELLFSYSNKVLRIIDTFIRIISSGSIWTLWGRIESTGCRVIALLMLKTGSVFVFLYGGNIPFVVSLYFASQRTPTACPCCAGSISTIGLRSFLLKVSGSNSLLSFCCTSLVSGLIIQEEARFVYWHTAQRINFVFVQC